MVFSEYDPICLLTLTFSLMIRRPVLALMLTNLTWLEYPSPCHKFEKKKKFPHWNLTEAFRLAGGHPGVSLTITKITPLRSHPLPINWHPVIHTPIHHVSSPVRQQQQKIFSKKIQTIVWRQQIVWGDQVSTEVDIEHLIRIGYMDISGWGQAKNMFQIIRCSGSAFHLREWHMWERQPASDNFWKLDCQANIRI